MSRTWKRFLSLLLVATMILSLGVTGFAADNEEEIAEEAESRVAVDFEQVDNDTITARHPLANAAIEEAEPEYAEDEIVRVSIVLDGQSALGAGYSPASAKSYRASLKAEQDAVANRISDQVLGGAQLDVVWNLTLAANIISAYVEYGQIEEIKSVIGVKDVVIETQYFPTEDEVNNGNATVQTNTAQAWDLGYTGAGSLVAIVDTGLDVDHLSFDAGAFEYAIDELNETREEPVVLLTADDISAVWDQLNAAEFISDPADAYVNAKVPFGANYVDGNLDIIHLNDDQGEHGSHVAGIAAANKYIPTEDGYERALDTVVTQGQAPDAQLLVMKVFGSGGGAYDSDYFSAIEDALVLGADSVNLSLGSGVAGFTQNSTYDEIIKELVGTGLVWANSAGNNSSWGVNAFGALYADDINYHTGGSPATYSNTLSVASVDNTGATGYAMVTAGGTSIFFDDGASANNAPLTSMPGTYQYIAIDGVGTDEDFAALKDVLEGKIAVCSRGSTSFYQKANAAVENGAIATVIYNNQAGTISMSLTGYRYTAPAVSITAADGAILKAEAEQKELNGAVYYEGSLTIDDTISSSNSFPEYMTMSSFSSWGGNGALTMKPEITAPGGNIWSVWGANAGASSPTDSHEDYELMSGTSMASPQVAGLNAVLKQYIREAGLADKLGLPERTIAQSLLMSTAIPLRDANSNGEFYSILAQGAGLASANDAINARSLVRVTTVAPSAPAGAAEAIDDGKVKIELGEVYNGFDANLSLTNFSDEEISFYLNGEFFTQEIYYDFYRLEETVPVNVGLAWAVNGEAYEPLSLSYDFNGDGVTNGMDAQYLLDACADGSAETIANADLNEDGKVNTADAKIAFEKLNGVALTLAAGETAEISVRATYNMSAYDEFNGNYVEGFLFIQEGASSDGALGTLHSIPVFGFNGSISDATMFDRGSYLESLYEIGDIAEDKTPYMVEAGALSANNEAFIIKYAGESGSYAFGGNPWGLDDEYHPERNAINGKDAISGVQYSQIRNAGAGRFFVTYENGVQVSKSEIDYGPSYAAYYYPSGGAWRTTTATTSIGWTPADLKEGAKVNLNFQLAPEYYITYVDGSPVEVAWDDLGAGTIMSIPAVIDNTAPDIVKVEHVVKTPVTDGDEFALPVAGDEAQDKLEVTVHDNQYVAAVGLYTEDGEELGWTLGAQDTIRGKENVYTFDIAGNTAAHLLVEVYDYACNLATYKLNFNEEELNGEVSVTLSDDSFEVIRGGAYKLSANVYPWGVNDEVAWSSADESIATVDDNGIVTGVSVGKTTITATSMQDPKASASAEVEVFTIAMTAFGTLQDDVGQPTFFGYDFENGSDWVALGTYNVDMLAASYDWYTDAGQYFYQQDWDSAIHKIDIDTLEEVEKSGANAFGAPMQDFDFAFLYNYNNGTHQAFSGTEGYFLFSDDIMANTFNRGYNLGIYLMIYSGASQFVATAWAGGDGAGGDMFFALDDAGMLWVLDYTSDGGLRFGFYETDLQLSFAELTDGALGNSLVMGDDGEFYLAHFNGSTSELYQLRYNAETESFNGLLIANVGDDVWPASLLTVMENESGAEPGSVDHSTFSCPISADQLNVIAEMTEADMVEVQYVDGSIVEAGDYVEADGNLNGFRPVVDTDAVKTDVIIDVTADEETTNGKITIDFDPTTVTLISATPGEGIQFKGIMDESDNLGHFVLAYVALDPIPADETLLTLTFEYGSEGTVDINVDEINDKAGDETLVRLGTVGVSMIPTVHEHVFGEPKWTWADDASCAVATFLCEECEAARSFYAALEESVDGATCTKGGLSTNTATVEFNGKTYTDVKVIELPATGHSYGEPEWTWAEDLSSASAVFTCANCGDEQTVQATLEREVGEKLVVTATAEFEGETYTDSKELSFDAQAYGSNLNIGDRFTLNSMLIISDEILADEDAYVEMGREGADKPEKILLKDADKLEDNILRFSANIVPAWFNDNYTVQLFNGEGEQLVILDKEGNALLNGFKFTAQDYLERGLKAEIGDQWHAVFAALSDLGRYAQIQFNHNTGKLADIKIADLSAVTLEKVADYRAQTVAGESDLSLYGITMALNTDFVLSAYFDLGSEKAEDLTFLLDGEEIEARINGKVAVLSTSTVSADELDKEHSFVIMKGEETLFTLNASCYSYVYSTLNYSGSSANLISLVKTLYLYGEAAKTL